MEFVLIWVGLAVGVGMFAAKKGRSSGGWFVLACLISPILAGIFLALLMT